MEDLLIKNYNKNLEKSKSLNERWVKGDKVRVLKNRTENVLGVEKYLGKVCEVVNTVKHVPIFSSDPKIEYQLRLGNSIEPFWEYELDLRFKSKKLK